MRATSALSLAFTAMRSPPEALKRKGQTANSAETSRSATPLTETMRSAVRARTRLLPRSQEPPTKPIPRIKEAQRLVRLSMGVRYRENKAHNHKTHKKGQNGPKIDFETNNRISALNIGV